MEGEEEEATTENSKVLNLSDEIKAVIKTENTGDNAELGGSAAVF